MSEDYLPFSPPKISEKGMNNVRSAIESGWLGTGPLSSEFEERFALYKQVENAAAVSSCTSGLFLSMKALGIGPGDEVITTNMTFVSTVNSIIHCGATPVLVDVNPDSGNISIDDIEGAISERTRAILPVHYAGYPVEMESLMSIARKHNLYVIEDCAHAIETMSNGKPAGTFGDLGVFSFYATKNIAVGEGGMVISQNSELVEKVSTLALHGLSRGAWKRFSAAGKRTYDVVEVGYKANFTDVQAAIGLSQLEDLPRNSERRREIWEYYTSELANLPCELPILPPQPDDIHALHLYVVRLPRSVSRDSLVERLSEKHRVAFGVHYKAVSQFDIYREYAGKMESSLKVSEDWGSQCLSLSLSPGMSDQHVERVVKALKEELQ